MERNLIRLKQNKLKKCNPLNYLSICENLYSIVIEITFVENIKIAISAQISIHYIMISYYKMVILKDVPKLFHCSLSLSLFYFIFIKCNSSNEACNKCSITIKISPI